MLSDFCPVHTRVYKMEKDGRKREARLCVRERKDIVAYKKNVLCL